MNHGREKGSRQKPVKSRRPGYKGAARERALEEKKQEQILKEKRAKTQTEFLAYIRQRFGVKAR